MKKQKYHGNSDFIGRKNQKKSILQMEFRNMQNVWGVIVSLRSVRLQMKKRRIRLPDALNNQIRETEGERLMKHIREQDYVIALAIDGKMLDSVELSQKLGQLGVAGKSSIAFVIGGSLGLSDAVLKRADFKLSFSKMTFPHQLMQVILLEQIYRGYRILNHEPYHK